MANVRLMGQDCKLYYSDPAGSPTWVEVCRVKDLSLNIEYEKIEDSDRCNPDDSASFPGNRKVSVTFKLPRNQQTDAVYNTLFGFFWNKTVKRWLVADGAHDSVNTRGVDFDGYLFTNSESQNFGENVMPEFTIEPASGATNPPALFVGS